MSRCTVTYFVTLYYVLVWISIVSGFQMVIFQIPNVVNTVIISLHQKKDHEKQSLKLVLLCFRATHLFQDVIEFDALSIVTETHTDKTVDILTIICRQN